MANLNVKSGDKVVVIAGKDKGKVSTVVTCFPKEGRVVVKDVNVVTKHNKPKSAQDKGGITKLEAKIDVSNVQIVCPACNKATRVAHEVVDGKNVRVCKHCHASLDSAKKVKKAAKSDDKKTSKEEVKQEPATKAAPVKKATAKTAEKTNTKVKQTAAKTVTKTTQRKTVAGGK